MTMGNFFDRNEMMNTKAQSGSSALCACTMPCTASRAFAASMLTIMMDAVVLTASIIFISLTRIIRVILIPHRTTNVWTPA